MDGDGIINIYIYIVHLIMMSNKLSPTRLKYVGCSNTTCASKEEEIDILYNGGIYIYERVFFCYKRKSYIANETPPGMSLSTIKY